MGREAPQKFLKIHLKKEVSDLPTRAHTGDSFSHEKLPNRFIFWHASETISKDCQSQLHVACKVSIVFPLPYSL